MKFSKIRNVKTPNRGTQGAAGIDFYVPTLDEEMLKWIHENNEYIGFDVDVESKISIVLHPHQRVKIPSGIKMLIEENTALIAFNKSGVATKKGLDILACVVDWDYEGEYIMSVLNTSNNLVKIYGDEKLVQLIQLSYIANENDVIPIQELEALHKQRNTTRGEGGFGSTDNK